MRTPSPSEPMRLLLGTVALLALVGPPSPARATNDGTWTHLPTQLAPPLVLPAPAEGGSMFCDSARQRVILFGGRTPSGALSTLLTASLSSLSSWSTLVASGSPPSARFAASLVYDSARDRLLLFGGSTDGRGAFADLWELSLTGTPTWQPLVVPNGPPARYGHVAVYDPVHDRMIVFSGTDGTTYYNDTWQLSLAGTPAWSQLSFSGSVPRRRDGAAAIYDPVGQQMVFFSGAVLITPPFPTVQAETWSLSLSGTPAWTHLATTGSPSARALAGAIYDPVRRRMLLNGGATSNGYAIDLWAMSLDGTSTWTQIPVAGPLPGARDGQALAYDPAGDRAILFGGEAANGVYGDVWALALGGAPAWSLEGPRPVARFEEQLAYDPARNRVVQFGGAGFFGSSRVDLSETWSLALDGPNLWVPTAVAPAVAPTPRETFLMARDPAHHRLLAFGGNNGNQYWNDTWSFDLASDTWSPVVTNAFPPGPGPRDFVSGLYDAPRSRLIVFGGWDRTAVNNELWALDMTASPPAWQNLAPPTPRPSPRLGAALVYDSRRDRLVLYGGQDTFVVFGDVWAMPLSGPGQGQWTQLLYSDPSRLRSAASAAYDPVRDRLVVFGGYTGAFVNSVVALDLSATQNGFVTLNPSGTPPPVRDLAGVDYDAAHDRIIVTQGSTPAGAPYPFGDTWVLSFADQPTPTLLTFADEQTGAGSVRLAWFTPAGAGQRATAYRSADGAGWGAIAQLVSDAAGEFVLTDQVATGGRFDYRLGVAAGPGEEFTADHWVTIPAGVAFGILRTGGNPTRGALAVTVALAQAEGTAAVDLYDIRGRRVLHRALDQAMAGSGAIELAAAGELATGVYVVRLTQGARTAQRKVAIVR